MDNLTQQLNKNNKNDNKNRLDNTQWERLKRSTKDKHGNTILHLAVHSRNVKYVEKVVQLLQECGELDLINKQNKYGWSPLHMAARRPSLNNDDVNNSDTTTGGASAGKIFAILHSINAKTEQEKDEKKDETKDEKTHEKTRNGSHIMEIACASDNGAVLEYILQKKLWKNNLRLLNMAFIAAVKKDNTNCLEILLNHCRRHEVKLHLYLPLYFAAYDGNEETLAKLLNHEINRKFRNTKIKDFDQFMERCRDVFNFEVIDYLRNLVKAGAKNHHRDPDECLGLLSKIESGLRLRNHSTVSAALKNVHGAIVSEGPRSTVTFMYSQNKSQLNSTHSQRHKSSYYDKPKSETTQSQVHVPDGVGTYDSKTDTVTTSNISGINNIAPKKKKAEEIAGFKVLHTLGAGGFGVVKYGVDIVTKEAVALKFLEIKEEKKLSDDEKDSVEAKKQSREQQLQLQFIEKEIKATQSIVHSNVIKLIGYNLNPKKDNKQILLIYELMPFEMSDVLERAGRFKIRIAKTYFEQILSALEACHKMGIAHRDLKLRNILINYNFEAVIADFGLASIAGDKEKLDDNASIDDWLIKVGSAGYIAPEMYPYEEFMKRYRLYQEERDRQMEQVKRGKRAKVKVEEPKSDFDFINSVSHLQSCDVFALGVIFWKLINGKCRPFKVANKHDVYFRKLKHYYENINAVNEEHPGGPQRDATDTLNSYWKLQAIAERALCNAYNGIIEDNLKNFFVCCFDYYNNRIDIAGIKSHAMYTSIKGYNGSMQDKYCFRNEMSNILCGNVKKLQTTYERKKKAKAKIPNLFEPYPYESITNEMKIDSDDEKDSSYFGEDKMSTFKDYGYVCFDYIVTCSYVLL